MNIQYTETVFKVKRDYTDMGIPQNIYVRDYGPMNFGANLQRYRKRAGLDQGALGERIGKSQPAIQRWEAGTREPSFQDLSRLAEELEVSVADFFDDRDPSAYLPTEAELATMIKMARYMIPDEVPANEIEEVFAGYLHVFLTRFVADRATADRQDGPRTPHIYRQSDDPTRPRGLE